MSQSPRKNTAVVILAAGLGKRMHSPLPKVLHSICGAPMLFHIIDRIAECSPASPIAIVVGHGREEVQKAVSTHPSHAKLSITFVHQPEQKGTGHAARFAMESEWGKKRIEEKSDVLVLPGDLPLLPTELVGKMLDPVGKTEAMRILVCTLPDPTGYGRIVRKGKKGAILRIVEEKDANLREKAIREVGTSIYSFRAAFLAYGLQRLSNKNAQGEYYLTDLVAQASQSKKKIDVLEWPEHQDLRGVNDLWELAQAERMMNERTVRSWAKKGVRFVDPWSTRVDAYAELAPSVVIGPGSHIAGKSRIAAGATIGAAAHLRNTSVGEHANVKIGTLSEDSSIGAHAAVGPYAHLRPESSVGAHAKIGNFVELKKSKIGEHTSIAHLSYLGDAEVGRDVNIGCGFVTCNFDGRVIEGSRKHKTVIEDGVFMGSDCQVLAPIRIGKGSYVASGSTITEDVEPGSLAIARSKQIVKPGYAQRLKSKKD